MTATDELRDALRARYAPPEWVLFEEATLDEGSTRVDALALNTFPSSGHQVVGFELKATRRDWLRELRVGFGKSATFAYCHRWWLLTPPGVADDAEVPEPWGHMVLRGSQLRRRKPAPALSPAPFTQRQMFLLLRRAERPLTERLLEEYRRGLREGEAGARRAQAQSARWDRDQERAAQQAIEAFEAASGVRIRAYRAGDVGAAVAFVLAGGLERQRADARWARRQLLRAAEQLAWAGDDEGAEESQERA